MTIEDIIDTAKKMQKPGIIGISGFGGAGKSTLASTLSTQLSAPIVGIDGFFSSIHAVDYDNWEIIDYEYLNTAVLVPFLNGQSTIHFNEMDWETGERDKASVISYAGLLIIEGVGLFRSPLKENMGLMIWVDCPLATAVKRGKTRDKKEYGVDNDLLWDRLWQKNDQQYYETEKPHLIADFIVECPGHSYQRPL